MHSKTHTQGKIYIYVRMTFLIYIINICKESHHKDGHDLCIIRIDLEFMFNLTFCNYF